VTTSARIRIDRLALEGDGVGRLDDGRVAFVAYSAPNETLEARMLTQEKRFTRWVPTNVPVPSIDRIVPPCPYHFRPERREESCGGCNWQHLSSTAQRRSKRELLKETLVRLGGVANPNVHETVKSPKEWRYRNKVQVPFALDRNGRVVAGFYAPGSHNIVEFDDCLVQSPESVAVVQFVKEFVVKNRVPIYMEDRHHGWLRHLLVRTNSQGQALVSLITRTEEFPIRRAFVDGLLKRCPFVIGVHHNIQPAKSHVILGRQWQSIWGEDYIQETVMGCVISNAPGSFSQVNTEAAELLYVKALDELGASKEDVVLDLYCGGGALTLGAAKRSRFAIGVESVASSINDARANAKRNNVSNVSFQLGEAEIVLQNPLRELGGVDAKKISVLIDPPRAGCDPRVLAAIKRLRPRRIVYVSCNPSTLARDVKILWPDYAVASVTPVDLFPQTAHIEAVCRLERK
jgi:23S rRNA (uracil1939-C5)-methyltransferase